MATSTTQQQYAKGTSVAVSRSREQIEAELRRMGASRRAWYDDDEHSRAAVMFEREGRRYRILLPLRQVTDRRFQTPWRNGTTRRLSDTQVVRQRHGQDVMERWRALAEYIKALRVALEAEILTIEEALLPYVLLPNGSSVSEWVEPQLDVAYRTGQMPPMLPMLEAPKPAPHVNGTVTITENGTGQ